VEQNDSTNAQQSGSDEAGRNPKGIRVFVYGTLKKGHYNNHLLKGSEFLGRCYVEGHMRMLDLRYFPGVARTSPSNGDSTRVYGEVYLVDEETLYSLDILEGHPEFFRRERVETPWKKAWMYFVPEHYIEGRNSIDTGIWNPNKEEFEFWGEWKDSD
jgi:gamma-glutamylcyclotransferase (GGCT)/AIG2-like uncharacterized protein YtfP